MELYDSTRRLKRPSYYGLLPKHRMAAQQMLIELGGRAHNLLVWTARELGAPLNQYGIVKLVRDVFQVDGYVLFAQDHPVEIGLNLRHPLACALCDGFNPLFSGQPQMKLWDPVEPVKTRQRG